MEVYFVRICLTQRVCTHSELVIVARALPSLPGYAAETASGRHFRDIARDLARHVTCTLTGWSFRASRRETAGRHFSRFANEMERMFK